MKRTSSRTKTKYPFQASANLHQPLHENGQIETVSDIAWCVCDVSPMQCIFCSFFGGLGTSTACTNDVDLLALTDANTSLASPKAVPRNVTRAYRAPAPVRKRKFTPIATACTNNADLLALTDDTTSIASPKAVPDDARAYRAPALPRKRKFIHINPILRSMPLERIRSTTCDTTTRAPVQVWKRVLFYLNSVRAVEEPTKRTRRFVCLNDIAKAMVQTGTVSFKVQ